MRPVLSALRVIRDTFSDTQDVMALAVLSFTVAAFLFFAEAASDLVLIWRMG